MSCPFFGFNYDGTAFRPARDGCGLGSLETPCRLNLCAAEPRALAACPRAWEAQVILESHGCSLFVRPDGEQELSLRDWAAKTSA